MARDFEQQLEGKIREHQLRGVLGGVGGVAMELKSKDPPAFNVSCLLKGCAY